MTEGPSISVVIPCYNVAEYIRSTVESVQAQTYPVKECVCVDDGSTDNTLAILRTLKREGHQIEIAAQANSGASAARNLGLAKVTGEYVQFLDADDLLHEDKLGHQASLIARSAMRPAIIAAAHRLTYVEGFDHPDRTVAVHEDEWIGLIRTRLGMTSSNLYQTEFIRQVGRWKTEYKTSEDTELTFRILRNGGRVVRDDCVLTTLRRRDNSLWYGTGEEKLVQWLLLRHEIHEYLKRTHLLTKKRADELLSLMIYVLHTLYSINEEAAFAMHDELMPSGYRVNGMGRLYPVVYNVLGFEAAERISSFVDKMRTRIS